MNIIFFTQEDPFYVKVFFEEFLKHFQTPDEIKAIVLSRPMGKKSTLSLARQMYDFYGPYDFLRMGMRYAYVKAMGKIAGHGPSSKDGSKTYTIKQLAKAYGVTVIERSDLNSDDFRRNIGRYHAELFISVASPIIFKKELIEMPTLDCINIHNAPLPKYRGMLPNFWQLYHGEKESGITIHRMNAELDAGDIIGQYFVPIQPEETLHELIVKTKKEDAMFMMRIINDYRQGRTRYRKMEGEGSYFTFPTRYDVKVFKQRGRRLL